MKYKILLWDRFGFVKRKGTQNVHIILAYVDDLMVVSNLPELLKADVDQFLNNFKGTEEPLNWI